MAAMDIEALRWRIAETIAWCTRRGPMPDVASATRLRTPELCPAGFSYVTDDDGYTSMEPSLGSLKSEGLMSVFEGVAARAGMLRTDNIYPSAPAHDLAGGRLLCYAPYENLAEGVEEQETQGYFDLEAVPPWDTWICFVDEPSRLHARPQGQDSWYNPFLISWVPPDLVSIVEEGGRNTSTTYALAWADELDSAFFAQLRAANVLPPITHADDPTGERHTSGDSTA